MRLLQQARSSLTVLPLVSQLACAPLDASLADVQFPGPRPTECVAGARKGLDWKLWETCDALLENENESERHARIHIVQDLRRTPGVGVILANSFTLYTLTVIGVPATQGTYRLKVKYETGKCVYRSEVSHEQPLGLYYPELTDRNYGRLLRRAIAKLEPEHPECLHATPPSPPMEHDDATLMTETTETTAPSIEPLETGFAYPTVGSRIVVRLVSGVVIDAVVTAVDERTNVLTIRTKDGEDLSVGFTAVARLVTIDVGKHHAATDSETSETSAEREPGHEESDTSD